MRSTNVKSAIYTEYGVELNDQDPKLKIADHAKISRYKNFFEKGHFPNWSEGVFIKKVKNTIQWRYVISNLNGEKIGKLKKNCQKQITQSL